MALHYTTSIIPQSFDLCFGVDLKFYQYYAQGGPNTAEEWFDAMKEQVEVKAVGAGRCKREKHLIKKIHPDKTKFL